VFFVAEFEKVMNRNKALIVNNSLKTDAEIYVKAGKTCVAVNIL